MLLTIMIMASLLFAFCPLPPPRGSRNGTGARICGVLIEVVVIRSVAWLRTWPIPGAELEFPLGT